MEKIKLNTHHAMCIQFFSGHGYSDEFVENMYKTIEQLKQNPQIEIVFGGDTLCEKCPNLKNGKCTDYEKVKAHDKRVSDMCGYENGQVLSAKDYFESAQKNIIKAGRIKESCQNCKWSELCR